MSPSRKNRTEKAASLSKGYPPPIGRGMLVYVFMAERRGSLYPVDQFIEHFRQLRIHILVGELARSDSLMTAAAVF